jgi:hypothetical protein
VKTKTGDVRLSARVVRGRRINMRMGSDSPPFDAYKLLEGSNLEIISGQQSR